MAAAIVLLGLVAASPPRDLATVERNLSLLVQGEPVPVKASPDLCRSEGKPVPSHYVEGTEQWYFDAEACETAFPPQPGALITSIAERYSVVLLESPAARARLEALLSELLDRASRGGLTPERKLILHSTAWELVYSLKRFGRFNPEMQPKLRPALCSSLLLLQRTRFAPDEIGRLPSNLPQLARLADAPEIAPLVAAMIGGQAGILEVVPPTDLHAEALFGRFTPRVFLTVAAAGDHQQFTEFLQDPGTPYGELEMLAHRFGGLQAVLVLYFNVLTADYTILPTEQVAFWQQYTISGTISDSLSFAEVADRTRFLTIAAERTFDGGGESLRYRKVPESTMSRTNFLDVKPALPGEAVTTLRGLCLRCHNYRVSTFSTHDRRLVSFARPLARRGRDLLTSYFIDRYEPAFRALAQQCAMPGKGADAAVEGAGDRRGELP